MPQTFRLVTSSLPVPPTGTLVIYVAEGAPPADGAAAVWASTGLDWQAVSQGAHFAGRPGQMIDLPAPAGLAADRLLVLGSGKMDRETQRDAFTDRGGSLLAKLGKAGQVAVLLDGPELSASAIAEIAAGMRLRHYRFDKYKTKIARTIRPPRSI